MQNFEKRRDRYNAFASFENPLVNLSFELEVPEFRPYCKQQGLPPFHFFLYHVLHALKGIDNFMYRIHQGEVIKIDDFWASYTVINQDQNLNFARFEMTEDLGNSSPAAWRRRRRRKRARRSSTPPRR
jgi:chloramphenicol O-acetyltransferase